MPIETLEDRKLFAVGPTATLASGVLTIEGTTGDDYVFIAESRDGQTLTVSTGVKGDSESRAKTTFNVADVTSIVVNGGDGNDTIRTARKVNLPMAIAGARGTTTLPAAPPTTPSTAARGTTASSAAAATTPSSARGQGQGLRRRR